MNNSLPVEQAKELIDYISLTNYLIAPLGDGNFGSKDEALAHVESTKYDPDEPLDVCFDTKQGNYWERAQVTYQDSVWFIEDLQMGGHSSKGITIESALKAFRIEHDPTCDYYPVELALV